MERNRRAGVASGSGVVLAAGRSRGRNPSDEEDRMEETSKLRFGKRPKKDMNGVSTSARLLIKRKRWGITQDTQPFGTHEASEEVKAEDGNELSAPPQLQKDVKSRVQSKEDKFFMDFSAVPRKRRSSVLSSSKLTSTTKRQQDVCFTQQQSPATMLNGSSSLHGSLSQNKKRRLKPSSTELQTMKVSKFAAVSDQEAEVAEALFVLASSRPAVVMDSKLEAKLGTEAKCTFSATHEHLVVPSSSGPDIARAGSKGKQPCVDADKKEGKSHVGGVAYAASSPSELVHSSVGETELESTLPQRHSLAGEANSCQPETSLSKIPAVSPQCVPRWPCHIKETAPRDLEEQCKDHDRAKHVKQETHINAKLEERRPELCSVKRTSTAAQNNIKDGLGNHDEALTNSSRSDSVHDCDGCISKLKRDLTVPPIICKLGCLHENVGELYSPVLVKADSVNGLKLKGRGDGGTQGSNQQTEEQKEQPVSERVRRLQDREVDHSSKPSPFRKVNDTGNSSVSSCFSSLSSTAVSRHAPSGLAGWMSGFSHLGYDGSAAATSWAATSSVSIDKKAAQLAMQLPHAAISSPVPKMKSCATHVYVAHYIHREQLATRHSLWSAALCRATTYNLNIPPFKPLDNERPREQKVQTHQTESSFAHNISQSSMQRAASSGSAHGSSVAVSMSASNLPASSRASSEASTVTASGHAMAAHAQYLQAMMQQSGVASFPHLFNGPPSQPRLIPHLRPPTQQAANVLPVQKQQQAKGAPSSPMEHWKGVQSPFQTQQQSQNLVETSASESSAHVKRESEDLSLMAPSGGVHVGKFQQISASLSSGQQQHLSSQNSLSSTRHQIKGLIFGASMTPNECHEQRGSYKREQYQSSHAVASVNDIAFTMKVQGYNEDRRVTMKQVADPFDLPNAVAEPCSQPLCGSLASSNEPSVNGTGLSLPSAVSVSGTQSYESAASLGCEQGSFFVASQKMLSLREAKTPRHHTCSSTSGAPSTPPRVCSSDSSASHNALEALSVWSSPPSVSKVAPSSALESPSDQKGPLLQSLSLHSPTVEAQHTQQAGQAQQCLGPDKQFSHTGQELPQGVSSPMLAADDDLHSSSSDFTLGATVSETPTNLKEYRKPLLDGGIQQVPAVMSSSFNSQTTVASS